MKLAESIFNDNVKGQALLELVLAVGIFAAGISIFIFFLLNSYVLGRLAQELTKAELLAEEGLEAARSIRDDNWDGLLAGNHGLAVSGSSWVFQGQEEDISSQLNFGKRQIVIENTSNPDKKKITSKVNWEFSQGRQESVELYTYLTNWQKIYLTEIRRPTRSTDFSGRTSNDARAYDSRDGTTFSSTRYNITADPSITFYNWQAATRSYSSLLLKYRYHADQGTNDTYAVAYSVTDCNGAFTDLIPLTSAGAPDNTLSVQLSPSQNLSRLCLKIYSQRTGSDDNKRIYTRDIWTEGTYSP